MKDKNKNANHNRQKLLQLLMEKLGQIMKSMHAINDFPFGDLQLSRPQFMILFFIAPKKAGATVKELAKFLRVTPSAVTQFIDILVEKKLVSRKGESRDRRIVSIKLTGPAKKQFRRFKAEYFKNMSDAFEKLSRAEVEQFIRLVGKIKAPNRVKATGAEKK